ncbi:MAG: 2-oxoglutarate dehydrogenase E1 component, partial [Pseudomonadota bacterium]
MSENVVASPFSGVNHQYLLELLQRYHQSPQSVDSDWHDLLKAFVEDIEISNQIPKAKQEAKIIKLQNGENRRLSDYIFEKQQNQDPIETLLEHIKSGGYTSGNAHSNRLALLDSIRALMLIRAYRMLGHYKADLDPLGLVHGDELAELDPSTYGFDESDFDRPIFINHYLGLEQANLREIISICENVYCNKVGIEFLYIQNPDEKSWIQEKIESNILQTPFSLKGKKAILERLTHADYFETFLDKKYRGVKRFGLDGAETLVPMIEQILKRGTQLGLEEVVFGMAHRGRLNILANVMHKPYEAIFAEFQGRMLNENLNFASGDVKYHLGASANRVFDDKTIHLSLTPNPSHLEAVNTVVLGKVRAKQAQRRDYQREKVIGLLLHGDAAFIGQGIVAETLLLSQLDGYKTGGTIHIAINNQIGFTTDPAFGRSSPYCSDMAKMIDAPVIHVNGDDPEICVRAAALAIEYRQRFQKDIIIDLWCYRRHGHNEGDEPMFTQPRMYRKIANHPRTREIYAKKQIENGILTKEQVSSMANDFSAMLEAKFTQANHYNGGDGDWLEGQWSNISMATGGPRRGETGVSIDFLKEIGHAITTLPDNLNVHPKLVKIFDQRRQAIENGEGIDWATAESLAFGSLLCESNNIRLSGEDCSRGTFSHRHAVLNDQLRERRYTPLNNIRSGQAQFSVIDSPLSEFGLLGFEYGFASAEPHSLVIWEAQFGDFANGAQVIIDQFIASGETKWLRMCGLVMLLPHGYEG